MHWTPVHCIQGKPEVWTRFCCKKYDILNNDTFAPFLLFILPVLK